jgi:putative transposase
MPDYRRAYVPGGTYFFTVKTFQRQPILTEERCRIALRQAIVEVRAMFPFESIAWILLPDHLHTIWRLAESDANFSLRWSLIKQRVTRERADGTGSVSINRSRQRRREGTIWQRRFWEHVIRDDTDLERHIDYIHYNPVKHVYVSRVIDWPYSTFHRYARLGMYHADWASGDKHQQAEFGE